MRGRDMIVAPGYVDVIVVGGPRRQVQPLETREAG